MRKKCSEKLKSRLPPKKQNICILIFPHLLFTLTCTSIRLHSFLYSLYDIRQKVYQFNIFHHLALDDTPADTFGLWDV